MVRCFALIVAALVVCAPAQAATVSFHTVAKGDGSSSSITRRQGLTIRGEPRWRALWDELGTSGRPRAIDFSRQMLIAVTQGRRPSGGHEVRIERVERTRTGLVVRVVEVAPGPGCVTTGVITSPYHVVRVPRTTRPVTFTRRSIERSCDQLDVRYSTTMSPSSVR